MKKEKEEEGVIRRTREGGDISRWFYSGGDLRGSGLVSGLCCLGERLSIFTGTSGLVSLACVSLDRFLSSLSKWKNDMSHKDGHRKMKKKRSNEGSLHDLLKLSVAHCREAAFEEKNRRGEG